MANDPATPITDLTTLGDIKPSLVRPKNLDPKDRTGTEDITQDEIQLPRLAIAQGLSPQVVEGEPQYIQGLTIGHMFNDVSEEKYGQGPLTVVPILRQVKRIEFDPNDKKVPLDRNVPAGDPRLDWNEETKEPPRATEFVEFISLLLRSGKAPEPVVVSIKATNKEMRRAAKLWNTYVATRSGPIYSGLYNLTSKVVKGKSKKTGQDTMYGVFIVKNAGFIPTDTPAGEALFNYAKEFHAHLEGKEVETGREAGEEDTFDTEAMERDSKTPNDEM